MKHNRNRIHTTLASAVLLCMGAVAAHADEAKIWTAPPGKLYVQKLTDEVMKAHPELASVTFHGTPPGSPAKTYAMFGGSYLDRIGNPDDPDDIMVIETGVTILDPRWHRTKDKFKKFVVQAPLRDKSGENIGLIVLAFHNDKPGVSDKDFFVAGTKIRDDLQKEIPSFGALFEPVK